MNKIRPAIIMGDIHGNASALEALITQVRARFVDGEVDLYHVGDLFDRGKNSKEVLEICIRENIEGVLGNHELWMRDCLDGKGFDDFALHFVMGGSATLTSYGIHTRNISEIESEIFQKVPESHKRYLKNLPLYRYFTVGTQSYVITHAGVSVSAMTGARTDRNTSDATVLDLLSRIQPEQLTWAKTNPLTGNLYKFSDAIQIFGHTPIPQIVRRAHYIALDTGCGTCDPRALSAIILPHNETLRIEGYW